MKIRSIILVGFIIIFCLQELLGQSFTDTIFYNKNGEICAKTVAIRYRYCSFLKTGEKLIFSGIVKDYYQNGVLALEGVYNEKGQRNGDFIYYNPNGKIEKKGSFRDGFFFGSWYYYDKNESLFLQLNFLSGDNFLPYFFVNDKGDTTLKDGTGSFVLDFNANQNIFGDNEYTISGSCTNGLKDGKWKYYESMGLFYDEQYEMGKFILSHFNSISYGNETSKEQKNFIQPRDILLEKLELCVFDIVFSDDAIQTQANKIDNYFSKKEFPFLTFESQEAINASAFTIVKKILTSFTKKSGSEIGNYILGIFYDDNEGLIFERKILFPKRTTEDFENSLSYNMKINRNNKIGDSLKIISTSAIDSTNIYLIGYYLSRLRILRLNDQTFISPSMNFSIYTENKQEKTQSKYWLDQKFYFSNKNIDQLIKGQSFSTFTF